MSDESVPCSRCGRENSGCHGLPGEWVLCEQCKAAEAPPALPVRGYSSAASLPGFRLPDERRPTPLWYYFGMAFFLCLLALGVIYFYIQRNSRDQAQFAAAMQAAEKAQTTEEGLRIVDRLLQQSWYDEGQKAQIQTLRMLLQKQEQVANAVAAARQEDLARKADAAKPHPAPPPPKELTLADAQAVYDKALRMAGGSGVAKDEAAAFSLISKAAYIGLPDAQHDLAAMFAGGIGCPSNLTSAVAWARKAGNLGDLESQAWLGWLLASGSGRPVDLAEAARWNELAAAQGDATAALNLGVQYVHGLGVSQDCVRAFALFSAAASHGNAEAHANLGAMYWKGLGVEQSASNAFKRFQRSQELGCVQGTFALGLLYGIGAGVAKDRQMAAACCLSAARSGHVGAQKQLGRMYLNGTGVSWSEQDAIYWYRMAAAQGDEFARQAVDAYRNTHLPSVFAPCESCRGKGMVERTCLQCRGTGTTTETVKGRSVKNCSCGWQMVNGRCPNCGKVDTSPVQTVTLSCPACRGSGHQQQTCDRCGGSGQVRVAGPAQATFAQMIGRPDPGISLVPSTTFMPVRLHPFRTGANRGSGI